MSQPSQAALPRHWTEVSLPVPAGWGELVADELADWAGEGRVGLETRAGVVTARAWRPGKSGRDDELAGPPGEPGRDPVAPANDCDEEHLATLELRRRFTALARRSGCPELAELCPTVRSIPDQDWAAAWRDDWKPFRVGRVVILPAGHEAPVRGNDVVLRVDPGGAFGTGRHGSTRGCLRALQQLLVPGQRLIDAGCGSGILAVTAALLGAEEVTAFDVDVEAIRHTERLAREHGVADRIVLAVADLDLLGRLDRPTDGLLANIDEAVLVPGAGRLAQCLRGGAWFALGGTRTDRSDSLAPALTTAGLELQDVEESGPWRTHIGRRPAGQPALGG